jgi:hypothetical protein
VAGGSLPTLTRNDSYTLRLRLLEKSASGAFTDIVTSGTSLRVGIGNIEELPTDGAFKLTCNGTTSGSIAYNATAVSVYNAISNNVSTVSLYGSSTYGSYLLTATQPNTAMSFGSDSFTLFPASSVIVNTRRNPSTGVYAQQVVKLVRDPIVYADTFTNASTAGQIVLSKISDGGTGQNETYDLSFGQQIVGGLYSLNWGGTSTTGIAPFASAVTVQSAISSGINTITSNISVQDNGKGGYTIQFTGRLAQTNVTTELLLDASGINFLPLKQTTLSINTAGVEDAFALSGEDTITPTIEIEITQSGTPKTIYQGNVTIRKDLITAGAVVPGDQASYYTKAEANVVFVEDLTSNVDATNRKLYNSSGSVFLDWQNNTIGTGATILDLSGTAVTITDGYNLGVGSVTGTKIGTTTSQKLAFYNSTPIVQPSSINAVSGLINLGLLASSTTYGVLPGSTETLAASATIDYGTLTSNTSSASNVTVTGSAIGDTVLIGLPSVVSAGVIVQGVVFAANTVCMTAINATTASRTIGSGSYRITVIGY